MNFCELVDILEDDDTHQRRSQIRKYLTDWQNPMEYLADKDFKDRYRLPKSGFIEFMDIMAHHLPQQRRGQTVPPMLRVLTFLRFVSSGSFESISGDLESVSQPSTSRFVAQISEVIASLRPQFVVWPSMEADVRKTREEFKKIAGLPFIIGALDCTHVRIQSVGGNESERFRNRKGYFSLNCQAICDANLLFTNIVSRWPGSAHDSTIFRESRIRDRFELGEYGDSALLADQAYPLSHFMLTPFRNPTTSAENRFNYAHKKTRLTIERAFGILKRIFPCLSMGLRIKVERSVNVVVACVVLYNFMRRRSMVDDDLFPELEGNVATDEVPGPETVGRGSARRISIVRNYFVS